MWLTTRQNQIYTYLDYRVRNALRATYPDLFFTIDDSPNKSPSFPCVLVKFLTPSELSECLNETEINAVLMTIECDITVTEGMGIGAANKVSDAIVDVLKSLQFSIILLPEFQNLDTQTKRKVLRARRTIGADDVLF